jgi:tRNA (guanine37-N1)-methyltransferase
MTMRIDILTLFPEVFGGVFDVSIIGRACDRGLLDIRSHNFRDQATDRHHTVDDTAYGGGAGMVLKPEPIFDAVDAVRADDGADAPVILLSPQGRPFTQDVARELSLENRLILVCGHYEGFDERVRHLATDEISLGDYVLSGGEFAAMVLVDAVARLVPGVLGSEASLDEESHADGLLEYPQYTRPAEYRGWNVPEILLSGHHGEIAKWRREQSLRRTFERRPELLERARLSAAEVALIETWRKTVTRSQS